MNTIFEGKSENLEVWHSQLKSRGLLKCHDSPYLRRFVLYDFIPDVMEYFRRDLLCLDLLMKGTRPPQDACHHRMIQCTMDVR